MTNPSYRDDKPEPISSSSQHFAGEPMSLFRPNLDSGKWHSMLADYSPSGMALLDQRLNFLVANVAWLREFSLNLSQIVGRPIFEVLEKLQDGWEEIYQTALQGKISRCETDVLIHSDGIRQSFYWEIRPWKHADGGIGGILVSFQKIASYHANRESDLEILTQEVHDLREQLLKERDAHVKLQEAQEQRQEESSASGILSNSHALDLNHEMLEAHRALVRAVEDVVLLTTIQGHVIAISPEPNLPLPLKKVGPEGDEIERVLPPLANAWQRILAGAATDDQPSSPISISWESEHGLKNLECRAAFAGTDFLILTIRDITRFQENRHEVHRLKSLFQKLPQPIFKTDRFGKLVLWNRSAQKLFGIQEYEISDVDFWYLFVDGGQPEFRLRMLSEIQLGKTHFESIACLSPHGKIFEADLMLLPHYPAEVHQCLIMYGIITPRGGQHFDIHSSARTSGAETVSPKKRTEADQVSEGDLSDRNLMDVQSLDQLLLQNWKLLEILKKSQDQWSSSYGDEKTRENLKQQIRWMVALRTSLSDGQISVSEFLEEMWNLMVELKGVGKEDFRFEVDVSFEQIEPSEGSLWILMIRELMRNVLLHARSHEISEHQGLPPVQVHLTWKKVEQGTELTFVDSGVGFPEGSTFDTRRKQGLELFAALVKESQSQVEFHSAPQSGTHWKLTQRHSQQDES